MQSPVVNELQRHMLQALLSKGSMTPKQLTELCKNAFGWSGATIRRTQKSLLKQGLVTEQEGLLTPMVTKEDLEDNLWDFRLQDSFEWTPPEQPEQQRKQPFFKSLWFWTTCVGLIVIAILSIALIQPSLPAATTADIPSQLLSCKEALDQWQAKEALQLLHITEIPNIEMPLTSYCFYGDDWMQLCWDSRNPYSTAHLSFMCRDGQLFISNNAIDVIHWKPTNLEYSDTPKPWPMTFSWQHCKLDYLDTTTSGKETHILFRVTELSAENASTYEVTFIFDQSQNLTTIKVYTTQSDVTRCDIFHLQESDPYTISQLFSESEIQNPNTEAPAIPEELEACKEALDKWQELDAYKIIREYTVYGDASATLESPAYSEYWKSGDNRLQLTHYKDFTTGKMYRSGTYYGHNSANGTFWQPNNSVSAQTTYVWPADFAWDDCDLTHKTTKKTVYGKHIIFSVVITDPEHKIYGSSPYYVCFSFSTDGQLESISVAMVGSDYISNMAVSVSTYRLVSEDADAITQFINNQILTDNEYVPEPG